MEEKAKGMKQVDSFVFHAPFDTSSTIGYYPTFTLGVGDQTMTMYSPDWCRDLECVRHLLEGYVFTHKAVLDFKYRNTQWIINLEREGHLYEGGFLCKVKIDYYHYEEHKEIAGYCKEKETLATLYEGLLAASFYQPFEVPELPEDPEDWWPYEVPDRMTAYRQMKSPIIEAFLTDDEFTPRYNKCLERQVYIDKVLILKLDNYPCLTDEQDDYLMWDDLQRLCGIEDIEEKCYLTVDDFHGWKEVKAEKNIIDAILECGMKLAILIQGWLPKGFDLWIETPVLRNKMVNVEMHLITPKGTLKECS